MDRRLNSLRQELELVGYFPELVLDVVEVALAGQAPTAILVVPESALGHGTIGWHLTVLVLTKSRLIMAHVDDADDEGGLTRASATTTSVSLSDVRQVRMTHLVDNPTDFDPATTERTITVAIGWGAHRLVDLEAVTCPDPDCLADHGYQGNTVGEDITFTVSSDMRPDLVALTMTFLRHLWATKDEAAS